MVIVLVEEPTPVVPWQCQHPGDCPEGITCCELMKECHCDCVAYVENDFNATAENYDDCPTRRLYLEHTPHPPQSERPMPILHTSLMIGGTIGVVILIALLLSYYSYRKHKQDRLRNEHSKGVLYYLFDMFGVKWVNGHMEHRPTGGMGMHGGAHAAARRPRAKRIGWDRNKGPQPESAYWIALKRAAEMDRKRGAYLSGQWHPQNGLQQQQQTTQVHYQSRRLAAPDFTRIGGEKQLGNGFTDGGRNVVALYAISERPQTHVSIRMPMEKTDNEISTYV